MSIAKIRNDMADDFAEKSTELFFKMLREKRRVPEKPDAPLPTEPLKETQEQ